MIFKRIQKIITRIWKYFIRTYGISNRYMYFRLDKVKILTFFLSSEFGAFNVNLFIKNKISLLWKNKYNWEICHFISTVDQHSGFKAVAYLDQHSEEGSYSWNSVFPSFPLRHWSRKKELNTGRLMEKCRHEKYRKTK